MHDAVVKRQQYLFPAVLTYYEEPLVADRGEGMYLYDVEGRQYLDFFGGILTISIGHCHPEVTAMMQDQSEKLVHSSTMYVTQPMSDLAALIAELAPGDLDRSLFTNSGTEAIEAAILLAKAHTGSNEVIALRHSYHGRSMLAMALTGHANWRGGDTYFMGIKHAHSPYCYRCSFGQSYPGCDLECAKDVEELIRTTTSGKIAGLIAEPIQGVGGFITPPPEYFPIVAEIVHKYGGLFISDEVQTGWGRTGKYMFGIQHWGVQPDVMTMAKGVANGAPMGATVASTAVAKSFPTPTITTFGGNPVSSTAALATLNVIVRDDLKTNAHIQGQRLRQGLEALKERFPAIGDVRGMGLMVGVELVGEGKAPDPKLTDIIMNETRRLGLLIGRGGLYSNMLRISPPLTVSASEIDDALDMLGRAFTTACKSLTGR